MGLPVESKSKLLQSLIELRHDPLKHFTKDKPWWRLAALVVWVSPRVAFATVFAWLSIHHWPK